MLKRQNKNQPRVRRPYEQEPKKGSVFSYYSSRSPRDAESRRGVIARDKSQTVSIAQRLPVFLSLLAMAVAGFYLLTLTPHARLVIADDAKILRPENMYQTYVDELLSDSVLNRFKFSLNSDAISQKMQERFPELQRVTVSVPLVNHRPVVEIDSVEPAFILETNSSNRHYLAYDGRAIAKVSDISVSLRGVTTVIDQTNLPVEIGSQVLPTDLVNFVAVTVAQLKAADVALNSIILPINANELHVRPVGVPYFVKFYTIGDARLQTGTFIATKHKLEREKTAVNEYIDVRVEERAYYR